jgi:alkaline phosphatase D
MKPDPDGSQDIQFTLSRRSLLKAAAGGAMVLSGGILVIGDGHVTLDPWLNGDFIPVSDSKSIGDTHWLGPHFWGNRLQDWRLNNGRIECLNGEKNAEVRTVALLTREIGEGNKAGHLQVKTGIAQEEQGSGFCGFLIGIGGGELDYRAAALAQRGSGQGGGTLCTFERDGRTRFREHTNEHAPLQFAELPAQTDPSAPAPTEPTTDDEIILSLNILPRKTGRFDVELTAYDADSKELLAGAIRRNVPEAELKGGIALVSSPPSQTAGTRWWFEDLHTGGEKIKVHPERALKPILGTLYSIDDDVLKLTAQLMPIGTEAPQTVRLEYRPVNSDTSWRMGQEQTLDSGYTALFRVEKWDTTQEWEYRVVYDDYNDRSWTYSGRVPKKPDETSEVTIGLFSCVLPSARRLEAGTRLRGHPRSSALGRYTNENIYFPHQELIQNSAQHDPDLLVFAGDQVYGQSPTRVEDRTDPELDFLYKWYLWLWAFRDLTRNIPAVVLVDDHDIYQWNVWGNGGEDSLLRGVDGGGYLGSTEFINRIQRIQCGHNPDTYDPTPLSNGIHVYYSAFQYGNIDFALIEDRKFKSPPPSVFPLGAQGTELLGERQEKFLAEWAQTTDSPTICLTQTCFACAQTNPNGQPLWEYDTNGYPKVGRDRAIELLRRAGALVLSGDQHVATLIRHGIDSYTDGVVQFSGPAGGTTFQRWFEPDDPLPNGTGYPHTGDFTDAFGNDLRMLAVANPKISFQAYRNGQAQGQYIGDRQLKREGYGIVRVDHETEEYLLECWPWYVDPTQPNAMQYPGWPYRLTFDATGKE